MKWQQETKVQSFSNFLPLQFFSVLACPGFGLAKKVIQIGPFADRKGKTGKQDSNDLHDIV